MERRDRIIDGKNERCNREDLPAYEILGMTKNLICIKQFLDLGEGIRIFIFFFIPWSAHTGGQLCCPSFQYAIVVLSLPIFL